MKARILSRVNAFIAFLLGILGFGITGCVKKYGVPDDHYLIAEYGCPYAALEVKGKVTDENLQPLENIRVVTRYQASIMETYTDGDGNYQSGKVEIFPVDSVDIIATDTSGIYPSDSVRVPVTYEHSHKADNNWDAGEGTVYQDFQLKQQ